MNNRVQVFTQAPEGHFKTISSFKTPEQPAGIAINSVDTVYVRSGKDGSVSVFNAERKSIKRFGKIEAESAFGFVGIAVDNNGELLVCDDSNDTVVIY